MIDPPIFPFAGGLNGDDFFPSDDELDLYEDEATEIDDEQ